MERGGDIEDIKKEREASWEELTVKEHVDMYIKQGMDKKEAMKAAAKDRGVSKRDIYNELERD